MALMDRLIGEALFKTFVDLAQDLESGMRFRFAVHGMIPSSCAETFESRLIFQVVLVGNPFASGLASSLLNAAVTPAIWRATHR